MAPAPALRTLVLIALSAAVLSGCGRAPGLASLSDERFVALDADADGRLSRQEAQLSELGFAELDRNGDGLLSRLEWRDGRASGQPALRAQVQNETLHQTNPTGPRTW